MDRESFERLRKDGAFDSSVHFVHSVQDGQNWEMPISFDEVETHPFPVKCLPAQLAEFVMALAESTQTPLEMAGVLSLGVLATAFQSKFTVEITPDWREPLCLYCVAVAPPGERKSAVISALTNPIFAFEQEFHRMESVAIAQNQAEKELLEKSLEAAKSAAAKGKGNFEEKREEVLTLSAELAQFKELHPLRLLVDDTTPEKLVDLMDVQGGSITVCSAEGGLFDAIAGRYDRTANFDVYLKGHAGDTIVVDRIGRKTNCIPNPRLTIILTIQPEVLSGIMRNASFRGRGLCGRFLYAMCKSKVGYREISPPPIPDAVREKYKAFVWHILPPALDGSGIIHLSPDADEIRKQYQGQVEHRLGNEWESMRDWGGKVVGAAVRIAALIHAAEAPGDPTETTIQGETMVRAVKIAESLSSHAEAAYQLMGANEDHENARYLWRKLRECGQDEISKRDLFRLVRGKFKKADDIETPLSVLAEYGYIRIEEMERRGAGRKASPKIKVNPLALGHNGHNGQN